jgi:hypothetical protein
MKIQSIPLFLIASSLITSASSFTGTAYSSKSLSFVRRPLTTRTVSNKALNMVRISGLEVREEGATPTGERIESNRIQMVFLSAFVFRFLID